MWNDFGKKSASNWMQRQIRLVNKSDFHDSFFFSFSLKLVHKIPWSDSPFCSHFILICTKNQDFTNPFKTACQRRKKWIWCRHFYYVLHPFFIAAIINCQLYWCILWHLSDLLQDAWIVFLSLTLTILKYFICTKQKNKQI